MGRPAWVDPVEDSGSGGLAAAPETYRATPRRSSGAQMTAVPKTGQKGQGPEHVWVAVRVRPFNDAELLRNEQLLFHAADDYNLECLKRTNRTKAGTLKYNRVFAADDDNLLVYNESAQALLKAALDGINSTIFVYGQTGSGKTYTMNAIMDKAADELFHLARGDHRKRYVVRMQGMEIYNEIIRDLLVEPEQQRELRTMESYGKDILIAGLTDVVVASATEMRDKLLVIEDRRQVFAGSCCTFARLG